MIKKTDWFDYVTDEDMQVTESHHSMIMYSHEGKIFAIQKACGGRSIFTLNDIYHPTDGNCVIMTGNKGFAWEMEDLKRVNTVAELNACIDHANTDKTVREYNE